MWNKEKTSAQIHEILLVLLICIICGAVILFSLKNEAEIKDGLILDNTEEYFGIGYQYYSSGELALNGVPSVFRPPGYPVFVALGLHARNIVASFLSFAGVDVIDSLPIKNEWVLHTAWVFEDGNWIMTLQFLMLFVGGLFFYLTTRWWLPAIPAVLFLAAYLVNPLTYAFIKTLSYPLLDFVMITILAFVCFYLTRAREINLRVLTVSSLLFAIAAFIRPVFLTAPFLMFGLLFLVKRLSFKEAFGKAALSLILMAIFISPYILRNFFVTGGLVPISNQATWALWGNSVTPLYSDGSFREWGSDWTGDVWIPFGAAEVKEVTGSDFSLLILYAYSQPLSEHFGKEFLENLMAKPSVYLQNTAGNIVHYIFGPRNQAEHQLLARHIEYPEAMRRTFSTFNLAANFIVLPILGYFAYRKEVKALMGLLLVAYFSINYSIVFLDARYLSTLMPVMWLCLTIASANVTKLLRDDYKWAFPQGIDIALGGTFLFFQAFPVFLTLLG